MPRRLFKSSHFQIKRLTDGVYAAIASGQGYASCNAGIIDIGDKTIVFDAFLTPEAAEDFFAANLTFLYNLAKSKKNRLDTT